VPQLLFSGVVIDFNKMNHKINSEKYVPAIGDLMTSRWTYEAMAVTQFKNNKFESYFYEVEGKVKNFLFYRIYLIPELVSINNNNKAYFNTEKKNSQLNNNLTTLRKEIQRLNEILPFKYPNINDITSSEYSPKVNEEISNFLFKAKKYFYREYLKAINEKEIIYEKVLVQLGGKNKFLKLKEKHFNKQLVSVLLNDKEVFEYEVSESKILRKKNQVYFYPD